MEKTVRSQNLKFSVEFPDDDRESLGVTKYEVVKRKKENGDGGQGTGVGGLATDDRDQGTSGRDPGTDSRDRDGDEATTDRTGDRATPVGDRDISAGDGGSANVGNGDRDRSDDEKLRETGDEYRTTSDRTTANDDHGKSRSGMVKVPAEKEIKAIVNKVDELEQGEFEWDIEPVKTEKVVKNKDTKTEARHIKNERIISEKRDTGKTSNQNTVKTVRQLKQSQIMVDRPHIQAKSERRLYKTHTEANTVQKTVTESVPRHKESKAHTSDVAERLYKRRKIWDKDQHNRNGE